MYGYHIGDIEFKWEESGYSLKQDDFMREFLSDPHKNCEESILYQSKFEDVEKFSKGVLLQKNGLYELYQLPEGKFIVYHWARCRFAFGFWLDDLEKEGAMTYYFSPEMNEEQPLDAVRFFSCAGMHSKLLQKGAVVLHSSYVNWNGKAILFCGQSGVGKSTQANLWKKYEGTEIINGDRTLLKKKDGKWMAYGYPCCGSSAICLNKTLPLHAIIMLEHGRENALLEMTFSNKLKTLIAGCERYLWSETELERVYQISEQIASEVPIFKYRCTPDEAAVIALKKELGDFNG